MIGPGRTDGIHRPIRMPSSASQAYEDRRAGRAAAAQGRRLS